MSEAHVAVNGVELCTQSFGDPDAPALVMIMGARASMLGWPTGFCEQLAAKGRFVIRYDNRDTGRSTRYPVGAPAYDLRDLADDAVGVMAAYGREDAHVCGMSMGGMIAQLVALRHPERVRTLTLISTTPDPLVASEEGNDGGGALPLPRQDVTAVAMAGAELDWADKAVVTDHIVELLQLLLGTKHRATEAATLRERIEEEIERTEDTTPLVANHGIAVGATPRWRLRLGEITAPTLVVHGTEDGILPFPHAEALAEDIPGAHLLALDGVGHELPRPEWDVITDALVAHTDGR